MTKKFKQEITLAEINNQLNDITVELHSALKEFPVWPCDPIHAVSIMAEEAGEATRAANQLVYEEGTIEALKIELIQTAAMCIRVLCGIESGDIVKGETWLNG